MKRATRNSVAKAYDRARNSHDCTIGPLSRTICCRQKHQPRRRREKCSL